MQKLSELSIADLKVTLDYLQQVKSEALQRVKDGEERDELYLKRIDIFSFHTSRALDKKIFSCENPDWVKVVYNSEDN